MTVHEKMWCAVGVSVYKDSTEQGMFGHPRWHLSGRAAVILWFPYINPELPHNHLVWTAHPDCRLRGCGNGSHVLLP